MNGHHGMVHAKVLRVWTACVAVGIAVVASGTADAVVWSVNPGGTGDAPTIQAAFDLASSGDLILLEPGVYTASNTRAIVGWPGPGTNLTEAVAHMKAGVSIGSTGGADVTIIDGESDHHGLVGNLLGAVEISGITFRSCHTNGNGGGTEIWGGGVLIYRSSPTIRDNGFFECVARLGGGGGGVLLAGGSAGIVTFNKFVRCLAGDLGGGLELFVHSGAEVTNNTFVGCRAADKGGAIVINTTTVDVSRNIFADNTAAVGGGALACLNSHTVTGGCNVFWNNSAPVNPHVSVCAVDPTLAGNVVADPLFCDAVVDDYGLFTSSPAAADNSGGCQLIGACPVSCGPVAVEAVSWGKVKASHR